MSTTSPKPCSRRATWAGCPEHPSAASSSDLRFLFALVAALLLIAGPAAASSTGGGTATPYTVTSAEARLEPDGLPAEERRVQLPFRWDQAFPGRGGKATYRIALPAAAAPASEPAALLFAGVGNQVAIEFNGTPLAGFGTLGDPSYDTKGTPFVPVAASLQRTGAAQELVIRTTVQRQRGAALATLQYGTERELLPRYRVYQRWRHTSVIANAAILALMGCLSGALWLRQREALYGCFALAALSGLPHNVDRVRPDMNLPWPLWGVVIAVCYALHIGLITRFVLLVLQRGPAGLVRALYAAMGIAVASAIASFVLAWPALWTAGLVLLNLTGVACLPVVARSAWVERRTIAMVLLLAGVLAILAGMHDLLLVRMGFFGGSDTSQTPRAMFFFVLILAGLVVDRYSRTVADYGALNATLAERVAEREGQLRVAFDALRLQQQEQAVLLERQRIMREIHDGVGSQLVGLLNVVTQPAPDRAVVEEHVKLALDEMRMAVDSLQPTHDDLATVLATLRYRLQPRLDAAGIALVWDVGVIPPVAPFSAQAALQLQRILLEAFTNVLKHARATRIVLHARWQAEAQPPRVHIVLTDNGVGLRPAGTAPKTTGHGIANMRARALSIGARLEIAAVEQEENTAGGTRITLEWPGAIDCPQH